VSVVAVIVTYGHVIRKATVSPRRVMTIRLGILVDLACEGLGFRLGRASSDRNLRGRRFGRYEAVGWSRDLFLGGLLRVGQWHNGSLNRVGDLV